MIPPLIVQESVQRGVGIIAITDHNASGNIESVQKAAQGTDLHIIPGIEIQTAEEVHVLCLFDELDQIRQFQKLIDASLPDQANNTDFFGEQFIVDETGEFIRREERLLLTSTNLTFDKAWKQTISMGGLFIPAHVNRKAYGLFQILGFVPSETPLEILEISTQVSSDQAHILYPSTTQYQLIQNGDAHFLDDIKAFNHVTIEKPTLAEIRLAVLNQEGRRHKIIPIV
jgi:3',5'-nucleoside bisphosphate phosphatase